MNEPKKANSLSKLLEQIKNEYYQNKEKIYKFKNLKKHEWEYLIPTLISTNKLNNFVDSREDFLSNFYKKYKFLRFFDFTMRQKIKKYFYNYFYGGESLHNCLINNKSDMDNDKSETNNDKLKTTKLLEIYITNNYDKKKEFTGDNSEFEFKRFIKKILRELLRSYCYSKKINHVNFLCIKNNTTLYLKIENSIKINIYLTDYENIESIIYSKKLINFPILYDPQISSKEKTVTFSDQYDYSDEDSDENNSETNGTTKINLNKIKKSKKLINYKFGQIYFNALSKFIYEYETYFPLNTNSNEVLKKYFEQGFNIILFDFNLEKLNLLPSKFGLKNFGETKNFIFTFQKTEGNKIFGTELFFHNPEPSKLKDDLIIKNNDFNEKLEKYSATKMDIINFNLSQIVEISTIKVNDEKLNIHYHLEKKYELEKKHTLILPENSLLSLECIHNFYFGLCDQISKGIFVYENFYNYMNIPLDVFCKKYFEKNKEESKRYLLKIFNNQVKLIVENFKQFLNNQKVTYLNETKNDEYSNNILNITSNFDIKESHFGIDIIDYNLNFSKKKNKYYPNNSKTEYNPINNKLGDNSKEKNEIWELSNKVEEPFDQKIDSTLPFGKLYSDTEVELSQRIENSNQPFGQVIRLKSNNVARDSDFAKEIKKSEKNIKPEKKSIRKVSNKIERKKHRKLSDRKKKAKFGK